MVIDNKGVSPGTTKNLAAPWPTGRIVLAVRSPNPHGKCTNENRLIACAIAQFFAQMPIPPAREEYNASATAYR
jgi:hypothetical protein